MMEDSCEQTVGKSQGLAKQSKRMDNTPIGEIVGFFVPVASVDLKWKLTFVHSFLANDGPSVLSQLVRHQDPATRALDTGNPVHLITPHLREGSSRGDEGAEYGGLHFDFFVVIESVKR